MSDLRERILAKLDEWTREEEGVTPGPWRFPGGGSRAEDLAYAASSRTVRPLLLKALRAEVERHRQGRAYSDEDDQLRTSVLRDSCTGCNQHSWPCAVLREIARNLGVEPPA